MYRPTIALPPNDYIVQVRSLSATGAPSEWVSRAFTVAPVAANVLPSITAPVFKSTVSGTNTLFAWTQSEVAGVTYQLWVSELADGTRVVYEESLTGISFNATSLSAGKYRAWVRAVGTGVAAGWSVGVDFTVADNRSAQETVPSDLDAAVRLTSLESQSEAVQSEPLPVAIAEPEANVKLPRTEPSEELPVALIDAVLADLPESGISPDAVNS
ncbi:MAG: hypothetical protein R3C49_16045 [Planctomycetaceae bacterium]